jgi:hypothetical protein
MNKPWLIFSQVATILLVAVFIFSTLNPDWLSTSSGNPLVNSIAINEAHQDGQLSSGSYHHAAKQFMPVVFNIFRDKSSNIARGY